MCILLFLLYFITNPYAISIYIYIILVYLFYIIIYILCLFYCYMYMLNYYINIFTYYLIMCIYICSMLIVFMYCSTFFDAPEPPVSAWCYQPLQDQRVSVLQDLDLTKPVRPRSWSDHKSPIPELLREMLIRRFKRADTAGSEGRTTGKL